MEGFMSEQSLLQLGMECLKAGKLDEAIQYLEQATVQSPGDYKGFNFLGIAYALKGLNNRAIGTLEAAGNLRPDIPSVQYNLGLAYKADGIEDRAKEHFDRALELDPHHQKSADALSDMVFAGSAMLRKSCARHADEPAVAECSVCRLALCDRCKKTIGGVVCCPKCAGLI